MVFQERTYSVLIVTTSDSFTAKIMPLLPVTDYWPVTTVHSIGEARRKIVETAFDIVLINAPLPDDFGMRLAVDICASSGATRGRMRQMEAKQATVEEKIEEIRLVNRAKWLLIERLGMTEPEAHRYIEKQSMDLRISKREAAKSVIKTYK